MTKGSPEWLAAERERVPLGFAFKPRPAGYAPTCPLPPEKPRPVIRHDRMPFREFMQRAAERAR